MSYYQREKIQGYHLINLRKEGLMWMIKAIWNLGSKVITGYLPKFLDEEAIMYIFDVKTI